MRQQVDTLIEGSVITSTDKGVIDQGAVAVSGDRIIDIGKASELRSAYGADRILGGPRRFVLPGLIDCHNHLAQALVREFALEDLPNIHRIYRAAERVMTPDDARISARVAIGQLLRAGVTTVAETTGTSGHVQAIAETVMETGIRCAMACGQGDRRARLAGVYDQVAERSAYHDDAGLLKDELARTEEFLRTWEVRGEGRLRPWIHTQSVASCSDERFLRSRELAKRYGTGVMHHVNRDREEVELSVSLFGRRPIEHLHTIGALGSNVVAVHAMLATDREIQMLAAAGTSVAHAPLVCGDLLSAVTRVPAMRAAGVTVGLGCDTVTNDILAVMRTACVSHALGSGIPLYDPLALTAEDAFAMGTIDAARVLLWEREIGSLEVGKAADIVVVDGNNLRLAPVHNPIGVLVRYSLGSDVESVLVGGQIVVDNGEVLGLDEGQLIDEAADVSLKLAQELGPRRYRALTVGGVAV